MSHEGTHPFYTHKRGVDIDEKQALRQLLAVKHDLQGGINKGVDNWANDHSGNASVRGWKPCPDAQVNWHWQIRTRHVPPAFPYHKMPGGGKYNKTHAHHDAPWTWNTSEQ